MYRVKLHRLSVFLNLIKQKNRIIKMQIATKIFVMLAVVSLIQCQQTDAVIRNDFEGPYVDGSYRWAIQTEGGIYHEQKGSFPPSESEPNENSLMVEGQYQYTAPDGQVINVLYKAGENGFQPTGDHIPTPPPIPAAIQRALDYVARLRASQQ